MAMTWNDLAELRRAGLQPGLPVYVTNRPMLARNMRDVGCVAIVHRAGERMPVELLDGLDVRLDFGRCDLAGRVHRLMRLREVEPKRVRAWCECCGGFVATCGACEGEPWSN